MYEVSHWGRMYVGYRGYSSTYRISGAEVMGNISRTVWPLVCPEIA
jgi:hypothetical protein